MNLTKSDYKTILSYYKVSFKRKSDSWIKKRAEDILANKLCRCIKKVKKGSNTTEKAAIAICKNSIFTKRNIKGSKFSCKKKYQLKNYKNKSYKLRKTKRVIFKRRSE
tara:strand:- start:103 stop:426 length:324 start_codon:yes stop_codon:yes gene_type:complete